MYKVISLKSVVWLLLCLIWGTTWTFIKIGLHDLPPIGFASARFALAVLVLFVVIFSLEIEWPKSSTQWRLIGLTGILQFAINYSLIFWSEQYISSGLTAVLQATISVFGLVLAWVFLPNEVVTRVKLLGVALGVAGVAIVFRDQLRVQNTMGFLGCVATVVAAYSAAQSSVLVKARGADMHPVMLMFGQMAVSLPFILGYSAIVEGNPLHFHWTWRAVGCVLYLTMIGTVTAFWLFYWLLNRVESTKAMMISVVTPLIAVIVGRVFLGEKLPAQTFVGGLLIVVSLALIVVRGAQSRPLRSVIVETPGTRHE